MAVQNSAGSGKSYVLAAIGGSLAGFVGSIVFKGFAKTPADIKASEKATETIVPEVAIAAE